MLTLSRKQREIQEREETILDVARHQLQSGGYHGLSMDRIAAEIEYSKGTIYQHFRNKEEILLTLANQALTKRCDMFDQAAKYQGKTRERIAAVGAAAELFVERFPVYFMVEQIVRDSSIWEKTSEDRRHIMQTCEQRCMAIVGGVVRDGVAHNDLELAADTHAEEVVFGLWSLYLGAQTILNSSDALNEIGITDGIASLRRNQIRLLDGYGWKPNSKKRDYVALTEQLKKEVFDDA